MENRTITWEMFIQGIKNLEDNKYELTNIECPKCQEKLYRRTDVVFTSYPPKYKYVCKKCGWAEVY